MFSLTSEPLPEQSSSQDENAGALVVFDGRVRIHNAGRRVIGLEYEAFDELAITEGNAVLEEALQRFEITGAACIHRTGQLAVGDLAVRVEVLAPHRKAAFAACEYIIDEVKRRVPIWKKEFYEDGQSEWLNPLDEAPEPAKQFYARQVRLPEMGEEGQGKLARSRVLVVGAGGLGCPALLYLAAAGVGTLGIVEDDILHLDNLHRQALYKAADVDKPKAELAAARLRSLNPFIAVVVHPARLNSQNVAELIGGYDIVLDCTDNFGTKFLLNDACVKEGKTLVQASVYQYEGQIHVYDPSAESPCLRCTWPDVPAADCVGSCAEVGVLGITPGTFGLFQATETLKVILGLGEPLTRDLLLVDLLTWETQKIRREKKPNCPACGAGVLPPPLELEVTWPDLEKLRPYVIVDIREPIELQMEPFKAADLHIPTQQVSISDPALGEDKNYILVCAHGIRSEAVARWMREQGRGNFYSLLGGVDRLWKSAR